LASQNNPGNYPGSNSTSGRIFYIDASNGNDSNDGFTPSTAWKTLKYVNDYYFSPGDKVFFKRGEIWKTTGSGVLNAQNGVTYGAYGSGANPIIDGNHVSEVFLAQDKDSIILQDLELRNGINSNAQFLRSTNITITNCEMSGAGNDNLIFIDNNSKVRVNGGKYHDPIRRDETTAITNIEIADGGNDFIIDGVELWGAENAGISIHNHGSSDPQGRTDVPTNIIIRNVTSHDNLGYGINIMTQDQTAPTSILVINSLFINNHSGIRIQKNSLPHYVHGNILIDQCVSVNNSEYSFFIEADDVTIQRSLFDGLNQQGKILNARNFQFLNNTVYSNPSIPNWALYITGDGRVDGITVKNNIFYLASNNGNMVGTAANSSTNVSIDYNEYYFPNYDSNARWYWNGTGYPFSDWVSTLKLDTHSLGPSSDPLFVNPAGFDFTLQAGSPAIDKGIDVGIPHDGSAPDLGAYPYENQ
jgi:hypothetical protein